MLDRLGGDLEVYQPVLSAHDTDLELTLTIAAGDIWLAVLLAMAAMTNLGFAVVRLDALPIGP